MALMQEGGGGRMEWPKHPSQGAAEKARIKLSATTTLKTFLAPTGIASHPP